MKKKTKIKLKLFLTDQRLFQSDIASTLLNI